MIKYFALALMILIPQLASAVVCPGGSAFELRRPSDNFPLGCIDGDGNVTFGSSVTTNGTFFGDGSGLTGVGGGVGVGDNNIWTGTNIFQSTVTFGPAGIQTTADYSRVVKGGTSEIAFSTFSAVTSMVFNNFNSSYTTILEIKAVPGTSTDRLWLRFDGSTTGYDYFTTRYRSDSTTEAQNGTGTNTCSLTGNTNFDQGATSRVEIKSVFGIPGRLVAHYRTEFMVTDSVLTTIEGRCLWDAGTGTDPTHSIDILAQTGTITGVARLMVEYPSSSLEP